jgi:hypothetical protein
MQVHSNTLPFFGNFYIVNLQIIYDYIIISKITIPKKNSYCEFQIQEVLQNQKKKNNFY